MATNPQPLSRPGRYTYGDYRRWNDEARWELIDGEAYLMAPAPTRSHQQVVVELLYQIRSFLDDKPCEVYVAPFDVRLPRADEADDEIRDVVQPDLVVVCDPARLDEAGCRGGPDWVIEVLSPSTAGRDHIQKRVLYQRAGVREYWLVHPTDRILTRYLREDQGFNSPKIDAAEGRTPVAVLPGLEIDWGFWRD